MDKDKTIVLVEKLDAEAMRLAKELATVEKALRRATMDLDPHIVAALAEDGRRGLNELGEEDRRTAMRVRLLFRRKQAAHELFWAYVEETYTPDMDLQMDLKWRIDGGEASILIREPEDVETYERLRGVGHAGSYGGRLKDLMN